MQRYISMDPQSDTHNDESIKQFVVQSQQGDNEAFGQVYDILANSVYKYIYVRVLHKQIAEDLLSLTFMKAWQGLSGYKIKSKVKFSTWLFQICRNALFDYYRGQKWEVDLAEIMNKENDKISIEKDTETKLGYQVALEAMTKLKESHQTVLTLRFINQLSVADTAQVMKKNSDAVRSLQLRAFKALRDLL